MPSHGLSSPQLRQVFAQEGAGASDSEGSVNALYDKAVSVSYIGILFDGHKVRKRELSRP